MALTPAVAQILLGTPLWTPQRAIIKPQLHLDARDTVWSGSNLSSISGRGFDAGAMTVGGTPTKGTAVNGIDPIRMDASGEYLRRTLSAWTSGQWSFFFFGRAVALTSNVNGLVNRGWNSGTGNVADKVVLYGAIDSGSIGSLGIGNRAADNSDSAPFWECADLMTSTADFISIYSQLGATNIAWKNGAAVAFSGATLASNNSTGAAPNYAAYAWEFGRGSTEQDGGLSAGETSNSDWIAGAVFPRWLPPSEIFRWEGYYANLTKQQVILPANHPYKYRAPRV